MSQLKEILEREKDRSSLEQCGKIHLFREGTFYRAYEWSAWLFTTMANKLKRKNQNTGQDEPLAPCFHSVL